MSVNNVNSVQSGGYQNDFYDFAEQDQIKEDKKNKDTFNADDVTAKIIDKTKDVVKNLQKKNPNLDLIVRKKKLGFHARYSAKKRQYEYIILNRVAKPSIEDKRSWQRLC